MKALITLIVSLVIVVLLGTSGVTAADIKNITDPVNIGLPGESYTSTNLSESTSITSGIATLLVRIVPYILALSVVSLIIAGIYYLISWGNEEKVKKAKNLVIMTIV